MIRSLARGGFLLAFIVSLALAVGHFPTQTAAVSMLLVGSYFFWRYITHQMDVRVDAPGPHPTGPSSE